ncbi:MAG: hypothetical protein AAF909_11525 [Pseudomonadota bacterium]
MEPENLGPAMEASASRDRLTNLEREVQQLQARQQTNALQPNAKSEDPLQRIAYAIDALELELPAGWHGWLRLKSEVKGVGAVDIEYLVGSREDDDG